jgi:hypothetical protein
MPVAAERNVGELQLAFALHVNLIGTVYQDVRHGRILQERLEWAETHDLVLDALYHPSARFAGQRG